MKITGRQLMVALDALRGSLRIADGLAVFTFTEEQRRSVYSQIINQQGDALVEVSPEPNKESET